MLLLGHVAGLRSSLGQVAGLELSGEVVGLELIVSGQFVGLSLSLLSGQVAGLGLILSGHVAGLSLLSGQVADFKLSLSLRGQVPVFCLLSGKVGVCFSMSTEEPSAE